VWGIAVFDGHCKDCRAGRKKITSIGGPLGCGGLGRVGCSGGGGGRGWCLGRDSDSGKRRREKAGEPELISMGLV